MPELAASTDDLGLDYARLVRELVEPLLDAPEALRVYCEYAKSRQRVLIRVAFEAAEQGRVLGRGGRNIQAIRTVIATAAALASQEAHLEIFGSSERGNGGSERRGRGDRPPRRSSRPPQQRSSG